jgi:hypothetical protein
MTQQTATEVLAQREREAAEQKAAEQSEKCARVKPGNKRTRRGRGRPKFVPTPAERRFVQAMSGLRMSADEICKVVGGGRARDTDSGRPISKTTLFRHFKTELASGRAMLKARVAGKFYNALDEDQPWAIQMAMRNQFGWDAGRGGFHLDTGALIEAGDVQPLTQIEFVVPGKPPEEGPPAPAPGPYPWQKALPAPEPMVRDAFGVWRPLGRTE